MKIVFVIPSVAFLESAGARIRYLRMVPLAKGVGVDVQLIPIADFLGQKISADIVVFSKCFDARAIAAAVGCESRGILVGVDLFDDYFSQTSDSRMTVYRTWLSQMLNHVDFAICSTPRMAEVVHTLHATIPAHIFNDPAPEVDLQHLSGLLAEKQSRALADRSIDLCWFGIGDNPFFPVGLEDMIAYSGQLGVLPNSDFSWTLTVLTNARALNADKLEALARLPLPVQLDLWTEEAEQRLLQESLCCFLPVNAQPFSVAKSLNRAVSALSSGCQVLSVGYPLYAPLEPLIYRDATSFLSDLAAGNLHHSVRNLPIFSDRMQQFASLDVEVRSLLDFFDAVTSHKAETPVRRETAIAVMIHGVQSNELIHAAAKATGALSVGTPFSPSNIDYDIRMVRGPNDDMEILISEAIRDKIVAKSGCNTELIGKFRGVSFHRIVTSIQLGAARSKHPYKTLGAQLSAYTQFFEMAEFQLEALLGPLTIMVSEASKLPFDPNFAVRAE
ncbi:MAG: hypothetical protein ACKOQ8_04950 [Micrococcales bacterium]